MKILYWGNCKDLQRPTKDQEILKALKKVAEVKFFDIKKFDMKKLLEEANSSDLFLFHAQIPTSDEVTSMLMVERIQVVLQSIKCKKVLWFMEKVWMGKAGIIDKLLPMVDYTFFIDETWTRRIKERVYSLHEAAPLKFLKGVYKPELACDIAYIGQMYGTRVQEYEFLKKQYGDGLKLFDNKFGQDLADICVSAKVIVIPSFPFDDFYWSDRIYTYLAYGGFVVCRRTYGLKEEGFIDGKHYFEFERDEDFMALIESVLPKNANGMRKAISRQGRNFVKQHTYFERIKDMLKTIENKS